MVACVCLPKSDEGIVVVFQLRMDVGGGGGGFSGLPKSVGGGRKRLQVEAVSRRWKTL